MRWLVGLIVLMAACAPATAMATTFAPTVNPLPAEVDALKSENAGLKSENAGLKSENVALASALEHERCCATFVMWDAVTTLRSGKLLVLGLPDTFTVHIQYTATTPVRARIMTHLEFVSYMNGRQIDVPTFGPAMSLSTVFHDAEGCGDYVLVMDAERDSVVTPNLTITRTHSPRLTGTCAN